MAQFSRTWWGQRFIQALEEFSDEARLGRGRAYARNGKVKEHHSPFADFEEDKGIKSDGD